MIQNNPDFSTTARPSGRSDENRDPDSRAWILDRWRSFSDVDYQVLLVLADECMMVELITETAANAAIRLIERAAATEPAPSSIITDNSSSACEVRSWLLERGFAVSTSRKALARMEKRLHAVSKRLIFEPTVGIRVPC